MLDADGNVLTLECRRAGHQGLHGRPRSSASTSRSSSPPQDIAAGVPAAELKAAASAGRAKSEGWRVRKDGSVFWANVVITPVHGPRRPPARLRQGHARPERPAPHRRAGALAASAMQEFIAMLAHELRNPLAPIRNAVSSCRRIHGLPAPVQRVGDYRPPDRPPDTAGRRPARRRPHRHRQDRAAERARSTIDRWSSSASRRCGP